MELIPLKIDYHVMIYQQPYLTMIVLFVLCDISIYKLHINVYDYD